MKALLHTCAVIARQHVPDLKEYYLKKTQVEGKHKMSVLNAIRFKLILRVYACVKQDRLYQRDSKRTDGSDIVVDQGNQGFCIENKPLYIK